MTIATETACVNWAAESTAFERLHEDGVCRFYRKGRPALIVWFGGIDEPFFSENFAYSCPFDCLYVRDTGYDWYTNGLHGAPFDRDAFSALLRDLALQYEYVVFCGQSSGGYGALYYGLKAEANLCIVFSPQTRNFYTGQNIMVPHVKLNDVFPLYRNAEHPPKVIVNVARSEADHSDEFEWQDHRQIERFRELSNVTIVVHNYNNHSVSVLMRNDGILYKYIISCVKTYSDLWNVETM